MTTDSRATQMDETCSNGRAISIIFVIIFRKADWINSPPMAY